MLVWAGRRSERRGTDTNPDRESRYASTTSAGRRLLRHVPESRHCMFVRRSRHSLETCNRERGIVDRGLGVLLEVAGQPTGRHTWVAPRILLRDPQRQLQELR